MDKREENARMLDPDRFKMAKSMSHMPGGPMNNNPMNVTGLGNQSGSFSGVNQFPYGDSGLENDSRMGGNGVYPMQNSGQPQQFATGQRLNSMAPYGLQNQPDSRAEETFEGARLGMDAQQRGLNTSQFMGMIGLTAQPAPGGVVPTPQQTPNTLGLQGNPSAEVPSKGTNMRSGKRA